MSLGRSPYTLYMYIGPPFLAVKVSSQSVLAVIVMTNERLSSKWVWMTRVVDS